MRALGILLSIAVMVNLIGAGSAQEKATLKEKIIGKWTTTFSAKSGEIETAIKTTYHFTKEGTFSLIAELTTTGAGAAPATITSSAGGTYKVLNEKEIEMTGLKPMATSSAKCEVVITGDELTFLSEKDAEGKLIVRKRVK